MQTLDSIIAGLAPILGPVSTAILVAVVLGLWWSYWAAPKIKIRHNPGSEEELEGIQRTLDSIDGKLGMIVDTQKNLSSKIDTNATLNAHRLDDIWAKVSNYQIKGE